MGLVRGPSSFSARLSRGGCFAPVLVFGGCGRSRIIGCRGRDGHAPDGECQERCQHGEQENTVLPHRKRSCGTRSNRSPTQRFLPSDRNDCTATTCRKECMPEHYQTTQCLGTTSCGVREVNGRWSDLVRELARLTSGPSKVRKRTSGNYPRPHRDQSTTRSTRRPIELPTDYRRFWSIVCQRLSDPACRLRSVAVRDRPAGPEKVILPERRSAIRARRRRSSVA